MISDNNYYLLKNGIKGKYSLYEYREEKRRKIIYINKEKLKNKTSLILINKYIYKLKGFIFLIFIS